MSSSSSSRDRRSEDLCCKVYIGGLGHGADSKEIQSVFGQFGRVQNVWVARHPPGFAFVAFEDPRDADDAVRCLDGTKLNGKRVRVEKSSGESRWEKWNLPPPDSSFHGLTLEYKDIREAILLRKQLITSSSRSLGRHRSSDRSSSQGHRPSLGRRSRSNDSTSGYEASKNRRRRRKGEFSRNENDRRTRPEGARGRRRAGTRRGDRHFRRRSCDTSSSARSSPASVRPWKKSRSRSLGKKKMAMSIRDNFGDQNANSLLVAHENGSELKCDCRTKSPEKLDAFSQTDLVSRQEVGIQCCRPPGPRHPVTRPRIRIAKVASFDQPQIEIPDAMYADNT